MNKYPEHLLQVYSDPKKITAVVNCISNLKKYNIVRFLNSDYWRYREIYIGLKYQSEYHLSRFGMPREIIYFDAAFEHPPMADYHYTIFIISNSILNFFPYNKTKIGKEYSKIVIDVVNNQKYYPLQIFKNKYLGTFSPAKDFNE